MSSEIKFIFFDMGKVLLEFDHQILIDQVAQLSGLSNEDTKEILFQSPHDLENRFERGELDAEQFHHAFCNAANCRVDKSQLMLAIADIFWAEHFDCARGYAAQVLELPDWNSLQHLFGSLGILQSKAIASLPTCLTTGCSAMKKRA